MSSSPEPYSDKKKECGRWKERRRKKVFIESNAHLSWSRARGQASETDRGPGRKGSVHATGM